MSDSSISGASTLLPECRSDLQGLADAKAYAALYRAATPAALFLRRRLSHVFACLQAIPGGRLLDVGCGPGVLLNCLVGGKYERHGVDCSIAMIRQAQAISGQAKLCLSIARLEHLPYPNQSFDVVLALGVLEYLPELEAGLMEIARVAKPNATIIISMLNNGSLYWQWRRHVWGAFERLRASLAGRSNPAGPVTIHSKQRLIDRMKGVQMIPRSVVYYDLNVGVEPLGLKFPRCVGALNRVLDSLFGPRFSTVLHTAFLVIAVLSP